MLLTSSSGMQRTEQGNNMSTNNKIRSRRPVRHGLSAAVALALILSGAALPGSALAATAKDVIGPAGGTPCGRVMLAPMVTIPVGKSSVIQPEIPVRRILLGNPENSQAARPSTGASPDGGGQQKSGQNEGRPGVAQVDVLLLSPNEIYLLGKTVGSTNIVLVDRAGGCTALDITVGMDVTSVQGMLGKLMPEETGIEVGSAYDSLVLSGTVSDAAKVERAVEIAAAYVGGVKNGVSPRVLNLLQVGAPQQVMLEVKVAEISKAVLDRFGIDFTRAYASGDGTMIRFLSGLFGGGPVAGGHISGTTGAQVGGGSVDSITNGSLTGAITTPVGDASIGGGTVTVPMIPANNTTLIGIDALKRDGLVKILAEPTVMAISGQEGSFLAGGSIFIPVADDDGGVELEEREFGVSVRFTPTVLEGGRINLEVHPEVSELNREGAGLIAPNISGAAILPAFTKRRASTTVQLGDGQSFAIGGLIKNNVTTNINAFPFLGEIPVLGALFRSTEFQTDRSELVFVVTPRLVKPLPPDYALPTDNYVPPSRGELILQGRTEGSPPAPAQESGVQPGMAPEAGGGFEPTP
ncbi:type II and III secretion system protein family protein [Thauera chlorobenzoica]|uniref:Type II/IV secretion system secretin RcpA/CpaC, associated with Flp pilus assembly n=1 Tax=Thauera chlorobenzoica TaxID=96773 RepID=A0A1L6FCD4_9RHOO|nr:type II and III secretion system protein family protein [Thauera chlorobenzoica]APR04579.1 Type II/IV secretion system secretin RcpA/CpaC, associated with Flp pilus assembly [Thauera chlorobenzoica]